MSIMMGSENPMFTMEHETEPNVEVGSTVSVSAKVIKKSEYLKDDGEKCFVCEYEVLTVDGEKPESEGEDEATEPEDDYKELEKTVDEEMSKSKGNKEDKE
jgi:hypothetical protein